MRFLKYTITGLGLGVLAGWFMEAARDALLATEDRWPAHLDRRTGRIGCRGCCWEDLDV